MSTVNSRCSHCIFVQSNGWQGCECVESHTIHSNSTNISDSECACSWNGPVARDTEHPNECSYFIIVRGKLLCQCNKKALHNGLHVSSVYYQGEGDDQFYVRRSRDHPTPITIQWLVQ